MAEPVDPLRRPPISYTEADRDIARQTYGSNTLKRILHFLHHQCDQLAPSNSPMLEYVAKILTNAGIKAVDIKELEEWTHSDWQTDANQYISTKYFTLHSTAPRQEPYPRNSSSPQVHRHPPRHRAHIHVPCHRGMQLAQSPPIRTISS